MVRFKNCSLLVKKGPREFKPFVCNRIREINNCTDSSEWRWVPSKENPADDCTRANSVITNSNSRWFNGPLFLRDNEFNWPKEENFHINVVDDKNEYIKLFKCVNCIFSKEKNIIEVLRFSSWHRLLFSVVRVLEAIDLRKSEIKRKFKNNNSLQVTRTPLERLLKAEEICIQLSQYDSIHEEIHDLRKLKQVAKNSRISDLNPKLDDSGNLISDSRLVKFNLSVFQTKPIILDAKKIT